MPTGKWKTVKPNKLKAGDLFLWKTSPRLPDPVTEGRRVWLMLNPETFQRIVVAWLEGTVVFDDFGATMDEGNPNPGLPIWVWEWESS